MAWERIEREWGYFAGRARVHWGRLTADDIAQVNASRDVLIARVQERYAMSAEAATREVEAWAGLVRMPKAA